MSRVDAIEPQGVCFQADREELHLDQRPAMDRFLAGVERRALRIAQLAVRDKDEALDIVQDSMIRLARSYAQRPEAEWTPLFYRILNNRITDFRRRSAVRNRIFSWWRPGEQDDPVPQPGELAEGRESDRPDRQLAADDAMQELEAAVQALPVRQREAFLLRTLEGLNVADTAAAMGCSQGSVKTHYSRAIHRLREELGEHWE
ncbi:MAG: RNA polymerase sigma factor [Gammaproteobacteria bacterium]